MRVALFVLPLALAVTQGQAQGLSTYLPSHAFGVSKASWWLSPEVVAAAFAAGSYGLQMYYYWENAAPLRLCSEKSFQLSELPSEPGSLVAVGEPQLQEQGGYCADVMPIAPEGEASLYFNSDGQIDLNRSTLTVNGQPKPLARLKTVLTDTLEANHLALSSGRIEGLDPSLTTSVRLDGSQAIGRQVPDTPPLGKTSGSGGNTPPPSSEGAADGGSATGGAVVGGSGTGGGGASAGGDDDDDDDDGLSKKLFSLVLDAGCAYKHSLGHEVFELIMKLIRAIQEYPEKIEFTDSLSHIKEIFLNAGITDDLSDLTNQSIDYLINLIKKIPPQSQQEIKERLLDIPEMKNIQIIYPPEYILGLIMSFK